MSADKAIVTVTASGADDVSPASNMIWSHLTKNKQNLTLLCSRLSVFLTHIFNLNTQATSADVSPSNMNETYYVSHAKFSICYAVVKQVQKYMESLSFLGKGIFWRVRSFWQGIQTFLCFMRTVICSVSSSSQSKLLQKEIPKTLNLAVIEQFICSNTR